MQKVITINLNGNAYQLDETAYGLLVAYLDGAELQLKDNPDKAEIIADLEQAIADKCNRILGPHKTVVTTAEVHQIIDEMGPVEGAPSEPASATQDAPRAMPARRGASTRFATARCSAASARVSPRTSTSTSRSSASSSSCWRCSRKASSSSRTSC